MKAKLAADDTRNLTHVMVETARHAVYLTGIVDNAQAKQRAADLASQVKGVRSEVNDLQIERAQGRG